MALCNQVFNCVYTIAPVSVKFKLTSSACHLGSNGNFN